MIKQAKFHLKSNINDIEFLNHSAQQLDFVNTFDVVTAI